MSYDYNKQYEDDYRLEHLKIGDVYYYDEQEEKFYNATLTLFGHCSELLVYDEKNELSNRIKSIAGKNFEIEYEILVQEEKSILIRINDDTVYQMSKQQFSKVDNYYTVLNKKFIQEREKFVNEVEVIVQHLQLNSEIDEILENFIDTIPTKYFVDLQLIAGLEHLIENESSKGRSLLLTDYNIRKSMIVEESKKNGKQTKIYHSLKRADEIMPYMDEHFKLLVKVIDKRIIFPTHAHGIYCVYRLLYSKAIDYHAKLWEKNFGEYYSGIDNLSFEETVDIYSRIDNINHKNLGTAGTFIYYLLYNNKFDHKNYILTIDDFVECLNNVLEEKKLFNYEKKITLKKHAVKYTIDDIDVMGGHEFEEFIALLFSKMGYSTELTKSSGDQGVDILVEKNGLRMGIQAKCYSRAVTNTAVQEVVAGKNYYSLDKVIVVSNNFFTKSAIELAESNDVILWDRNILKEKIIEVLN